MSTTEISIAVGRENGTWQYVAVWECVHFGYKTMKACESLFLIVMVAPEVAIYRVCGSVRALI